MGDMRQKSFSKVFQSDIFSGQWQGNNERLCTVGHVYGQKIINIRLHQDPNPDRKLSRQTPRPPSYRGTS